MCKQKNQTAQEHTQASGLGTMLVLDEEPASDQKPSVRLVENITYNDFLKRTEKSLAYKWIPHSHMSGQQVKDADCPMRCPGVTTCPSPCLCYAEQCYPGS